MKKFFQFAGLISLGLAAVGFILMMATHALEYSASTGGLLDGKASGWISGVAAIFGKGPSQYSGSAFGGFIGGTSGGTFEGNPAATSLLAWIFVLVAIVILLLGVILPLLKINLLQKVAGLLNLIAVCLLVIGGIFTFINVPVFAAANDWNNADGWALGVGWVFAGILFIAAGVIAIMPAAADFMAKGKKKK